jgi:hypothetical protein
MSDIFVSYSRVDEEFAHRLAADLDRVGAQVWLDVAAIPAGVKWSTAVQQGLDTCRIMLVIISPDSMASRNVEDEWHSYLDDGKTVIPILWRPARVHFQLRRIQYIDFHNEDYATAFEHLREELLRNGIQLAPLPEDAAARPSLAPPDQGAQPEARKSHLPMPPRTPTPAPAFAPTPSPIPAIQPDSTLMSHALTTFRARHWTIQSQTPGSAVLEGWSYGTPQQRRVNRWLIIGLAIVFGVVGGAIAAFIASKNYRKYTVQLNALPDGTLGVYGDLGQYTVSHPGDVLSLAGYVEVDRYAFGGRAPWVWGIGIGLATSYCWLSAWGAMFNTAGPYYY